ncbi:hypothetical protein CN918_26015 [Priestia megaterium]|nr:hypothetical protein CN918_26015 [Priestia megaterium]
MQPSIAEESEQSKRGKWGFGQKERVLTGIFTTLFIVSGFIAYFAAITHEKETMQIFNKISSTIMENMGEERDVLSDIDNQKMTKEVVQSQFVTSVHIFINNFKVVLFVMIGAVLTVYFFPTITVISNGAVLGLVLAALKIVNPKDSTWTNLFTGIVPHGIFEIPAIILGGAIGARLGLAGYRTLFKKEQELPYKTVLLQSSRFFLCILLPLLVIAAFVEMFITPHIMQ